MKKVRKTTKKEILQMVAVLSTLLFFVLSFTAYFSELLYVVPIALLLYFLFTYSDKLNLRFFFCCVIFMVALSSWIALVAFNDLSQLDSVLIRNTVPATIMANLTFMFPYKYE